MEDIKIEVAVDVTESGYIVYAARSHELGITKQFPEGIWKQLKEPNTFSVNALQVLRFKELEVPIVKVKFSRKPGISAFKAWWWRDWNDDKVYDIEVTELGKKKVTMLKMANDEIYYVDEPAEVFKNAVNRIKM